MNTLAILLSVPRNRYQSEENQINTTQSSPKGVTIYQTKNGCRNQQEIEYRQNDNHFLVLKAKRPVETHELLFGIETFYGI